MAPPNPIARPDLPGVMQRVEETPKKTRKF